ncbi:toxin-antitoxin system YwqK family antitoxin [Pinibacter aurantiacus]|uniref:Uncharacterized protein n=1 Tax=Pinibacter aurantiacus TaxID=2851599 RepID=A0A9E2S5S1_9BACT|nr:hypothetical protein [Pinibacter aurantiacus]MBV4355723.1 hypothetical protein [Pinibacter aurantiacus]
MKISHLKLKPFLLQFGFTLIIFAAKGQSKDSATVPRWINFGHDYRKEYTEAHSIFDYNRAMLTSSNDTLERSFWNSWFRDNGPITFESSFINGKLNGLQVGYYPNGIVGSVMYYLNGLPWDAVSLSDSCGHTYYPGSLSQGNGTLPFLSASGKDLGYRTFKNGHVDGPYLHKDVWGSTAVAGEVRYKPQCVNYFPAFKVKYKLGGTEMIDVFDTAAFNGLKNIFNSYVILNAKDSVKELERDYEDINQVFGDADAVPAGKWRIYDYETNKTHQEIDYDDCGNPIKITYYDKEGKIRDVRTYPCASKRKRKIIVQ